MKKLAIFVEGQTEQIFVRKLVVEVIGQNAVNIESIKVTGGKKVKEQWIRINAFQLDPHKDYYVQIIDCGGDKNVVSKIRDNYDSLVTAGFSAIIGIRDVFPDFTFAEVPKLRNGLKYGMKTTPFEVTFALGVMEIESWFLTEHTHFARLDPALTLDVIKAHCGFDPSIDDMQKQPHPAADLNDIYQIAGLDYTKSKDEVKRTVDVLDYYRLYAEIPKKLPDLKLVVDVLDTFLAT